MKQIITSLDVGSNSVKIVVGEIYNNELYVLASSDVQIKGIKKGIVVDKEKALEGLKNSFKQIEDIMNIKIDKVVMTVPSYGTTFLKGEGYTTIDREDKIITGEDITSALKASVYNRLTSSVELVNVTPVYFVIDEKNTVKDPKGKEAYKLGVNSIITTIPNKNINDLVDLLEGMNIKIVDITLGGLSDYYLFKKKEYDKEMGAVINIGSNKTEVSIINEGILINNEVLDVGGRNVDRDISYIYDLSLEQSKRLKEEFATSHKENANINEITECLTKSEEIVKINQYEVSEIVYSRVREILELAKKQINLLTKESISYIIITGGLTNIDGFSKVYKEVFGANSNVNKVMILGVRNNKYSSVLGTILMYNDKLRLRGKIASTVIDEEIFKEKKKMNDNSILSKVYGYFFDN